MDAKGNKVIKEEGAERRRQGDRGGGVGLVLENSARRAGHVGCVFYFFDS